MRTRGAFPPQVTIHHLLTHTGGTGDIFGPEDGRSPWLSLPAAGTITPIFTRGVYEMS
jgi:CubicO group peptidase (beta-lactamase class C family)